MPILLRVVVLTLCLGGCANGKGSTCEPFPEWITDGGVRVPGKVLVDIDAANLARMNSLLPGASKRYASYCTYQRQDKSFELVPRGTDYDDTYLFSRDGREWRYLGVNKVAWAY